jgi:hypothetical protein
MVLVDALGEVRIPANEDTGMWRRRRVLREVTKPEPQTFPNDLRPAAVRLRGPSIESGSQVVGQVQGYLAHGIS